MTVLDMFHREATDITAAPRQVSETVRRLERMGEWSAENAGGSRR